MWPKAIAQLIELAPHVTRLVPLADRFFQSKSGAEDANRKAMEAMAEGLRGDLGQVTAAHSGLYRQLHEQSETLAVVSSEVRATKIAGDSIEARVTKLQRRLTTMTTLLIGVLLLNFAALALLVAIFVNHR